MAWIADYGSVLCHYTESAIAFEHILAERRLRFSPYRLMRDPMESKEWVFGAASFPDNFEGQADEMEVFGRAHAAVNLLKSETKLLALSQDAPEYTGLGPQEEMFGRGWARASMWEHYGEDHRGACLVFDRDELDRELTASLAEAGVGALYSGEVRYTPAGLAGAFVSLHLDSFRMQQLEAVVADFVEHNHEDLFLLKTLDWAGEHEYRYLAMSDGSDYIFGRFTSSLRAVIVGEQCPPSQWPRVHHACEARGVTAYRLHWLHEGPIPVDLQTDMTDRASSDDSNGGSSPSS